ELATYVGLHAILRHSPNQPLDEGGALVVRHDQPIHCPRHRDISKLHLLVFVTASRQETKTWYRRNWKLEALARVKRHELYAIAQLVMAPPIRSRHQPFHRNPSYAEPRCNLLTDELVPVNHRHVSPRYALGMKSCEAVSDVVALGSEIRLCPQ